MKKAIIVTIIIGLVFCVSNLVARKLYYDGKGITDIADKYLGTPYKYGGRTPAGFDCSGYTGYVYNKAGYKLPRGASEQYNVMNPVRMPRVGDLVFFKTSGNRISHVGIYTGNYMFIHSPRTGKSVSYADIRTKYWKQRYVGARSIFKTVRKRSVAGL